MNDAEVKKTVLEEISKYPGFTTEDKTFGSDRFIKICKGQFSYYLMLHPMLEFRFIEIVRVTLETLAMYVAQMEVSTSAISGDGKRDQPIG